MKVMNMELDREQCWFDTHLKNHWNVIITKYYGIWSRILKVKRGDQIETTIIQGPI
jgi:hypothetical protein